MRSNKEQAFSLIPWLIALGLGLCSGCSSLYTAPPTAPPPAPPSTPVPASNLQAADQGDKSPLPESAARPTAPVAADADQSLPSDDNLWISIDEGTSFAYQAEHPRIDKFVAWYQNNPSYFEPIFKRAPLYLGHITAQLKHHEMPLELALLPFVESAYNPFAYSRSGAAGLWQFIPSTGDHMGLERNWWYDGRRDVERSTEAAIQYLNYLNRRFKGDWLLTLAAYNGGEGTVSRAMRRNAREGKATDFWSLKLSRETRAYVPQLLALARINKDPARYGLSFPPITSAETFQSVEVSGRINLVKAAELAGIDYTLVSKLNPGIRRDATAPNGPHRITLPIAQVELFKTHLAATPKHLWQPARQYIVKSGDTLGEIALKNSVPLAALKSENHLSSNRIAIGKVLNIPGTGISNVAPLNREARPPVYYRVKKGDSLWKIARSFGVSSQAVMRWNQLTPDSILHPNQKLRVHPGTAGKLASKTGAEVHYRVKRGDSLYTIARRHRISIADILRWNKINSSDLLQPGQRLRLLIPS